nr:uncharacterized protein LOC109192662 [Ipomoea trifida]
MNSGFLDSAINIPKLEHFEGVGFRRWQKKMKFLLAALNVAYVLSTSKPVEQENETLEAPRRRLKWENDDLACCGHILNGMSDTLFDIYQYEESSKDLWDVLEIRQHGMNMEDSIAIASIIDKLPPSWKKVHRTLMQKKEELTMEQLGSHLYVEEGIRLKESKNKGGAKVTEASGSTINFVDEGKSSRKGKGKPGKATKSSKFKKNGTGKGKASITCWVCNGPHFKKDLKFGRKERHKWKVYLLVIMAKEVANGNKTDDSWWVDTGATRHVCKDINLYKIYKSLENGPSLYMGNDSMYVHHLYGIHDYVT